MVPLTPTQLKALQKRNNDAKKKETNTNWNNYFMFINP